MRGERENTIQRCVDSLKGQKHTNWVCLIIQDEAHGKGKDQIDAAVGDDPRFQVSHNAIRRGALRNRMDGMNVLCSDGDDIIVDLDGDDELADRHVLSYLNRVYQDEEVWATYGQFKFREGGIGHCSDSYKPFYRLDPYETRIISHLRSYKYFLVKKIRDCDLKDTLGVDYMAAEDAARLWPVFEMAGGHLKSIPRVSYIYNNTSDLNNNKLYPGIQGDVGNELRTKPAYMALVSKDSQPFEKISVRLLDKNFAHCENSGSGVNSSLYIDWYRGPDFRPYTIYTEKCFNELINKDPNSVNIAWIREPSVVDSKAYDFMLQHYNEVEYVFTYDKKFAEKIPNSVLFPSAQTWIRREDFQIYPKTKETCLIASLKKDLPAHLFRYDIIGRYGKEIDTFGITEPWFENKVDILKHYRYAIEAQNCKKDFYFTERLIDCFLTGTVPIFWGCPSIGKFFNMDGIITFDTLEDLDLILSEANLHNYEKRKEAVYDNFIRAHEYVLSEDYIYNHFFRDLQAGAYIA